MTLGPARSSHPKLAARHDELRQAVQHHSRPRPRESERFPAYSRGLLGLLQAAGASLIVTSETAGLGPGVGPLGGLSFLFQNVVFLRYIELESEIRRAVGVIKMRDSDHYKGLRMVDISSRGFEVGEKIAGLTGLLGWSALRGPEDPDNPGL